ncbi:MAG: hypothetical protein P4L53_17995 [Candidatus Obscuribacterales bacterium]|nr:hypothetical protein [Candidatus Obscuribacterales bacterium]
MSSDDTENSFLNDIQIASPCPVSWGDMAPTSEDAKRFCGNCRKHVYSIDRLSANEARELILGACANNSSVCVRLFKRADGTIITDDCPVGLRRIRNTWRQLKTAVASAVLFIVALPAVADDSNSKVGESPLFVKVVPPKMPAVKMPAEPLPRMILGYVHVMSPREHALQVPSIKAIAGKVAALDALGDLPYDGQIERITLHLNLAQAGMEHNLPLFSSQELSSTLAKIKRLPADTDVEKSTQVNLLKEALTEKLNCLKQLKLNDNEGLQQQLDELQKSH